MLLIVSLPVYAGEGQQLHDQACLACHSALMSGKPEMMYLRTDKKKSPILTYWQNKLISASWLPM
jgi:hypothetical protein